MYNAHYEVFPQRESLHDDVQIYGLTINANLGFADLTSATSYFTRQSKQGEDASESLYYSNGGAAPLAPVTYYENDPSHQFARVLEFLGLPPDPARTAFPVVNMTIGVRSARLDRLLRQPPPALMALRRAAHAVAFHPMRALQRLNRVADERPPLRESFRAELEEYFSVDIAELEQLLGRGLWRSLRSAAPPHAAQSDG